MRSEVVQVFPGGPEKARPLRVWTYGVGTLTLLLLTDEFELPKYFWFFGWSGHFFQSAGDSALAEGRRDATVARGGEAVASRGARSLSGDSDMVESGFPGRDIFAERVDQQEEEYVVSRRTVEE